MLKRDDQLARWGDLMVEDVLPEVADLVFKSSRLLAKNRSPLFFSFFHVVVPGTRVEHRDVGQLEVCCCFLFLFYTVLYFTRV